MRAKKELLTKVLYQVFVRDYPPHGTLRDVKDDLKRIHDLGADILYLMPIQTIGKVGRKGSLGSPYAIEDYGEIDPSLGTEEDLRKLCEKAHLLGMKVILDVVYNHTARDSVLLKEHLEYFYKDKDGNFGNKAGAWSDVYDLDHSKEGLDDLLVSYLLKYQGLGIDGFRFDVASLLPSSFYRLAREKLGEECIFLAECIDTDFLNFLRSKGVRTLTNAELVESGIDFLYPYASFAFLENYLLSLREEDLSSALVALKLEEAAIPQDHFLTRCVENHDRRRINSYHDSPLLARNLLAFTFFERGPAFVYFGEECQEKHLPSLFEQEMLSFPKPEKDYEELFQKLVGWKKGRFQEKILATLYLEAQGHVLLAKNVSSEREVYGLFNLSTKKEKVSFEHLPTGKYKDLLSGKEVLVSEDGLSVSDPLFLVRE